jgi:hypothetical protein
MLLSVAVGYAVRTHEIRRLDLARVRRLPWLNHYATSLSFSASRFFSKSMGLRYPSVE